MLPKYKTNFAQAEWESLMGDSNYGIDPKVITQYAQDIKTGNRPGSAGSRM